MQELASRRIRQYPIYTPSQDLMEWSSELKLMVENSGMSVEAQKATFLHKLGGATGHVFADCSLGAPTLAIAVARMVDRVRENQARWYLNF